MKILGKGIIARATDRRGNYWPTVARLPDGRLAAVWSGGRRNHICPFGRLEIACSSDEGSRWSLPALLMDTPLDERDGGILAWGEKVVVTTFNNTRAFQRECLAKWPDGRPHGEGELIRAYLETISDEEEAEALGSFVAVGDGDRFSPFVKVPLTAPHGPVVGGGEELLYIGRAYPYGGGLREGIYCMSSADGRNWSEPVRAPDAPGGVFLCEPHGFLRRDGGVTVAARAKVGERLTLYFNRYENGKFGQWRPSGICGAPPHFLRLSDGRVVLTYGRREAPFGIRARVGGDDGPGEEIALTEDGESWDLGYPASAELKDGSVLTVWYQCAPGDRLASIFYAKWRP